MNAEFKIIDYPLPNLIGQLVINCQWGADVIIGFIPSLNRFSLFYIDELKPLNQEAINFLNNKQEYLKKLELDKQSIQKENQSELI